MYLYVLMSANGLFKIGKARQPKGRIAQIQTASPVRISPVFVVEYDERDTDLEKQYHERFAEKRVRGEWFALSKDDLLSIAPVREAVESALEVIDGDVIELWQCGIQWPAEITLAMQVACFYGRALTDAQS